MQNFKNTLLKHVYANAKLVMTILSILISIWALRMCSYMENSSKHNPNQHASKMTSALSHTFVNAIGIYSQPEVQIDSNDAAYKAGFEKLRACGQFSNWGTKKSKYESYNALVKKVGQVNQALAGLSQGYLSHQYQLNFDMIINAVCNSGYGVEKAIKTLGYIDTEAELKQLDWAERRVRHFQPELAKSAVSIPVHWNVVKNPWRGLDGCVYLANYAAKKEGDDKPPVSLISLNPATADKNQTKICQSPAMYKNAHVVHKINKNAASQQIVSAKDYSSEMVDNFLSLGYLLDSLNSVDNDSHKVTVELNGVEIPVGWNAQLTVNPETQTVAQTLASCVTGQQSKEHPICQSMSRSMFEQMPNMESQALVRQIGITVIDVPTGKIDAIAGDTSQCFRENYGAEPKSNECKPIPETWLNFFSASDVKANPAIYADYLPGSTVKPIQALAMVRAFPESMKNESGQAYAHVKDIMAHSNSEKTLDILTCLDPKVSKSYADGCKGFVEMQKAATDLGWNQQCASSNCGYQDIFRGQPLGETALEKSMFYGRLLTDVSKNDVQLIKGLDTIPYTQYEERKLKNGGKWAGSDGGFPVLDAAVHESFGQGNARATSLGVATMIRNLLAVANGDKLEPVHILENLWVADKDSLEILMREDKTEPKQGFFKRLFSGKKKELDKKMLGVNYELAKNVTQEEAQLTANLFTAGHRGSAGSACREHFGACDGDTVDGYRVFSKTGTPSFRYGNITGLTKACSSKSKVKECYLRPVKWFVLGVGEPDGRWSKVIAVMVERNWNTSGTVDDMTDTHNMAARIGFSVMRAMSSHQLLARTE